MAYSRLYASPHNHPITSGAVCRQPCPSLNNVQGGGSSEAMSGQRPGGHRDAGPGEHCTMAFHSFPSSGEEGIYLDKYIPVVALSYWMYINTRYTVARLGGCTPAADTCIHECFYPIFYVYVLRLFLHAQHQCSGLLLRNPSPPGAPLAAPQQPGVGRITPRLVGLGVGVSLPYTRPPPGMAPGPREHALEAPLPSSSRQPLALTYRTLSSVSTPTALSPCRGLLENKTAADRRPPGAKGLVLQLTRAAHNQILSIYTLLVSNIIRHHPCASLGLPLP